MVAQSAPSSHQPIVQLDAVLQQMRGSREPSQLFDLTIDYLRTTFAAPFIWLATYDAARHTLMGQGGETSLPDCALLRELHALGPGDILEQVVIEQRPISVPDVPQEPRMGLWHPQAQQLGLMGCLIYPFRYRRRCLGVLILGSQLWGAIATDEEKAVLGILLGQLATALNTIEQDWRQQQQKQIDGPILELGTAIRDVRTFDDRAEATIEHIRLFTEVSRVRLFWFEREQYRFVERRTNRESRKQTGSRISFDARELGDMYLLLSEGQLPIVGDGQYSSRTSIGPKILQKLKCQSLVTAPILTDENLMGFLSVEADRSRAWSAADRNFIVGAAHLLGLAAPLDDLDQSLLWANSDRDMSREVARSIYVKGDRKNAVEQSAQYLCKRLQASACLVLMYDPAAETFWVRYVHRQTAGGGFPESLGPLNSQDWKDLWGAEDALTSECYPEDLRLTSWNQGFVAAGVKALVAAHMGAEGVHNPSDPTQAGISGMVVVINDRPRAWTGAERELVNTVSRQLGVVLRQWQLQHLQASQAILLERLPAAIQAVQSAPTLEAICRAACEQLAQLLNAPSAGVVGWEVDTRSDRISPGQLLHAFARLDGFEMSADAYQPIDITRDAIVRGCWENQDPLGWELAGTAIPAWLQAPNLTRLLAIACPAPTLHSPNLLLFLGASGDRRWQLHDGIVLKLFRSALASAVAYVSETSLLTQRVSNLIELNWCKHRSLTVVQMGLSSSLARLRRVTKASSSPNANAADGSASDTNGSSASLSVLDDVARSIQDLTSGIAPIKRQYWHPNIKLKSLSLVSVVRRVLQRLETAIEQRKLWPRVHGSTTVSVQACGLQLELVLVELLTGAVLRSKSGGSLDIWNESSETTTTLLIVDGGEPLTDIFVQAMQAAFAVNLLPDKLLAPTADSLVLQSPGRELVLCHRLLTHMGGSLSIYRAEDGRNVTQVTLALASPAA